MSPRQPYTPRFCFAFLSVDHSKFSNLLFGNGKLLQSFVLVGSVPPVGSLGAEKPCVLFVLELPLRNGIVPLP